MLSSEEATKGETMGKSSSATIPAASFAAMSWSSVPSPDPATDAGVADAPQGGAPGAFGSMISCGPGMKMCSSDPQPYAGVKGLCVSIDDPAYGCGDPSCVPCNIQHGFASCAAGACSVGSCQPGWADCDKNPAGGFQADLSRAATRWNSSK